MIKKGFSLIEIIIILAIIATLGMMVTGLTLRAKSLSKAMHCLNNLKQISAAIESYQADWHSATPDDLSNLWPLYIQNKQSFLCPEDKKITEELLPETNSYDPYFVNRKFSNDDPQKLYLFCPRHFSGKKSTAAFLSYASAVVENKKVTLDGKPIAPGTICENGTLAFADGTTVTISSGKIGLLGSFLSTAEKIYSLIFIPEESNTSIEVIHGDDSDFEVVTPAVIAGVSGTRFAVNTSWTASTKNPNIFQSKTTVAVSEGSVLVEERSTGNSTDLEKNANLTVTGYTEKATNTITVPKKVYLPKFWFWFF
ncbi:MAG: hypothetical protein WDA18_02550 [Candidatus Ratteibacteria bacterium]|jgi:type II secretory pathway pseudopilin PulG